MSASDLTQTSPEWWLLRCPRCGEVVRAPQQTLEEEFGLVCGACIGLMRITEDTVALLEHILATDEIRSQAIGSRGEIPAPRRAQENSGKNKSRQTNQVETQEDPQAKEPSKQAAITRIATAAKQESNFEAEAEAEAASPKSALSPNGEFSTKPESTLDRVKAEPHETFEGSEKPGEGTREDPRSSVGPVAPAEGGDSLLSAPLFKLGMLVALVGVPVVALVIFGPWGGSPDEEPASSGQALEVKRYDSLSKAQREMNFGDYGTSSEESSPAPSNSSAQEDESAAPDHEFPAQALELAREFVSTDGVEERLVVAGPQPGDLSPQVLRDFLSSDRAPGSLRRANLIGNAQTINGLSRIRVDGEDNRYQPIKLIVTDSEDGPRIDIGASFGLSELPWDELDQGKDGQLVLVRALLEPDNYPNFAFRDQNRWQAWRLTNPVSKRSWYGYSEVGSETNLLLNSAFAADSQLLSAAGQGASAQIRRPLSVRLRIDPNKASHRQFMIEEIVSQTWIVSDGNKVDPGADESLLEDNPHLDQIELPVTLPTESL